MRSGEEWRPIPMFDGMYEASDAGRVRRKSSGRVLSLTEADTGYLRVKIYGKPRRVHCLVAQAFLAKLTSDMEVNHIDGDKHNNRLENLEYVTRSENMLHAYRTGLHSRPTGERHYCASLTERQVRTIRCLYRPLAFGARPLARLFGVGEGAIRAIVSGKTWKHIIP